MSALAAGSRAAAPASAYAPIYLWRRRPQAGRPITPRWVLLPALLAAALLALATPASAQEPIRFLGGDVSFDDARLHVRFTTTAEVEPPRVTSEPGALRVRFADATGDVRLDLPGDGGALRFVRVRPGAGDATVVVLRFPDRRSLAPEALRVERDGTTVDLSIPRSLLGTPRLSAEEAAAAAPPAEARTETAVEPEPSPEAEPAAEATEAPLLAPPAPLFIGGRTAPAASGSGPAPTEGWSSGRTGLLLLLTLVSGLGLVVFSWLRSRAGKGANRVPISVVATHRLSPRQQLVLVRALGQDHLLSIDGTKTERLLSTPSPAPEPDLGSPERRSQPDFGAQLAEMLGQPAAPDVLRSISTPSPAPVATAHAGAMAYAASPMLSSPPAASTSEAVQGLLRLRARAFR